MERILIDGYNLLYKDAILRDRARRNLEEARDQLIAAVAAYRSGDMEIILVFDGRGGRARRHGGVRGVHVQYSSFPQSADQMILELVERDRRRSQVTVVTSDRKDIGRAARAEGVRWVSSESFLRRLGRAPGRTITESEKPAGATAEEMDYWMKTFRSAAEEDAGDGRGSTVPSRRTSDSRSPIPISPRRRRSR